MSAFVVLRVTPVLGVLSLPAGHFTRCSSSAAALPHAALSDESSTSFDVCMCLHTNISRCLASP
jgi:hypothetical protein